MVNTIVELEELALFQGAFYGIFLWEFFTTLDYEWKVIRGRIPYRWTIWIYSVSRVSCLIGLIIRAVLTNTNVTISDNCPFWISFQLFFVYLALAAASLLIVLRITAIWNGNKVAVAMAFGVWAMNVGFFIQGKSGLLPSIAEYMGSRNCCLATDGVGVLQHKDRALLENYHSFCALYASLSSKLTIISLAVTDIILLLNMLVGLLRLRHDGYATFGLARLLWKQGVIWISLATVVEVPPAIGVILNLNDQSGLVAYLLSLGSQQFQPPTIVTLTIAATRMHRSLVEFATPDVMHVNFQISGLRFAGTNQIRATPSLPNPMETSVCTALQQHPTRQMSDHGLSTDMDEDIYEEPNGSTLEEDVECGV